MRQHTSEKDPSQSAMRDLAPDLKLPYRTPGIDFALLVIGYTTPPIGLKPSYRHTSSKCEVI